MTICEVEGELEILAWRRALHRVHVDELRPTTMYESAKRATIAPRSIHIVDRHSIATANGPNVAYF